jgi:hypothetical protein
LDFSPLQTTLEDTSVIQDRAQDSCSQLESFSNAHQDISDIKFTHLHLSDSIAQDSIKEIPRETAILSSVQEYKKEHFDDQHWKSRNAQLALLEERSNATSITEEQNPRKSTSYGFRFHPGKIKANNDDLQNELSNSFSKDAVTIRSKFS